MAGDDSAPLISPVRAEAIVVLGCAVRDGEPSPALARRIALALCAYRAGVAPVVVACGGRSWSGTVEALLIRDRLLRQIPPSAILVELQSVTTAQNAFYAAPLLRRLGARRAMLATCAFHLPRALADFRRCGIDAIAPPAEWIDSPAATSYTRWRERICAVLDAAALARMRRTVPRNRTRH